MKRVFALVDCNNFYASCERVFAPKLEKKPVAVLSNNDGVVIARSNETKKLGIPMGGPVFKYKKTIDEHDIAIFSSNFALYGDLSARVMSILSDLAPKIEIYSIDEAFLQLDGIEEKKLERFGKRICRRIKKWTGIPVSVGIACSKTLAKAANEIAKKNAQFEGVLNFVGRKDTDPLLMSLPVGDVWGIGREYAKWLIKNRIHSAYELKNAEPCSIKKKMGINGERLLEELKGVSCIGLEQRSLPKKQIICSRSFHAGTKERGQIDRAISLYATRAAEKLRKQKSTAMEVSIFMATSRFGSRQRYFNAASHKFNLPTAFTPHVVKAALRLTEKVFLSGYEYKKVGVMLSKIFPDSKLQTSLLQESPYCASQKRLMNAVDKINKQWGSHTIAIAQSGMEQTWMMKQVRKSKRCTTRWDELLRV